MSRRQSSRLRNSTSYKESSSQSESSGYEGQGISEDEDSGDSRSWENDEELVSQGQETPRNSSHAKKGESRSSERIRQRKNRRFNMPKRKAVWDGINSIKSPEKVRPQMVRRSLVSSFSRESHRYNYDPVSDEGSSVEEFIVDDDEVEESAESTSTEDEQQRQPQPQPQKSKRKRVLRPSSSSESRGSSDDEIVHVKHSGKLKRLRRPVSAELSSSEDEEAEVALIPAVKKDDTDSDDTIVDPQYAPVPDQNPTSQVSHDQANVGNDAPDPNPTSQVSHDQANVGNDAPDQNPTSQVSHDQANVGNDAPDQNPTSQVSHDQANVGNDAPDQNPTSQVSHDRASIPERSIDLTSNPSKPHVEKSASTDNNSQSKLDLTQTAVFNNMDDDDDGDDGDDDDDDGFFGSPSLHQVKSVSSPCDINDTPVRQTEPLQIKTKPTDPPSDLLAQPLSSDCESGLEDEELITPKLKRHNKSMIVESSDSEGLPPGLDQTPSLLDSSEDEDDINPGFSSRKRHHVVTDSDSDNDTKGHSSRARLMKNRKEEWREKFRVYKQSRKRSSIDQ